MSESAPQNEQAGDGGYVVVARRYRPRGFDELVGQEHVGRALTNAIETGRVGHAYLFTGARGVGKTSTARIFAKALNDPQGPTASPDNSSDIAQAIDAGEDVDVIEIDGASNRGIDEIRSLRANVGVRPSRSRFKIYIIDEVHMLTGAAFNALLKTLEEPPEHVKFIFCTTDPEKIPITVLSRCQRFDFAPVEVSKIVERLREIVTSESAQAEDSALELIARRAAGSMRDSQSLLEQVLSFSDGNLSADQVHAILGTADDVRLHSLAGSMADRDAAEAMRQLDAAIDAGVDAGRLAEQLLGYFRDVMAVTVGCDASLLRHTSVSMSEDLKELGQRWGLQTVLAVVGLIDQTLTRIRLSVHSRVLLEATLIQICNLPDLQSIADLAAAADSAPVGEKKKPSVSQPRVERESVDSETSEVPVAGAAASHPEASQTGQSSQASLEPALASSDAAVALMEPPAVVATEPQVAPAPSKVVDPKVAPSKVADSKVALAEPVTSAIVKPSQAWDQATAEVVWADTVQRLESMTQALANVVQKVEAVGDKTLRLVFPAEGALAMRRCELPEHRTALTDTLSQLSGQAILLDLTLAAPAPVVQAEQQKPTKISRHQRMREIENNDLVRSCVELFGAEIVRVDKPT